MKREMFYTSGKSDAIFSSQNETKYFTIKSFYFIFKQTLSFQAPDIASPRAVALFFPPNISRPKYF
jgi:hypothetical protein